MRGIAYEIIQKTEWFSQQNFIPSFLIAERAKIQWQSGLPSLELVARCPAPDYGLTCNT